jgi:hypothetical protein
MEQTRREPDRLILEAFTKSTRAQNAARFAFSFGRREKVSNQAWKTCHLVYRPDVRPFDFSLTASSSLQNARWVFWPNSEGAPPLQYGRGPVPTIYHNA